MKRMDIDALRQAHEKLKRKSQRQRDRIKELEEDNKRLTNFRIVWRYRHRFLYGNNRTR